MNKSSIFIPALLLVLISVHAQPKRPELPQNLKDQKMINGYAVQPLFIQGGGYGYDILQNNKPVLHQDFNPMPFIPKGIRQKEDAFKVAEWVINYFRKNGHWLTVIPPNAAQELNIQTH